MRDFGGRSIGNIAKLGLLAEGMILSLVGIGFAIGCPALTWLWPFADQPMTNVLLAALLISYGSGSMFVTCTEDWRAATSGGALALVVGFGGFALAKAMDVFSGRATGGLPQAIVLGLIAVGSTYAFFVSFAAGQKSAGPLAPQLVRAALFVLALALALMGYGLLTGWQGILPWRVDAQTGTLVGWLFVGFAADYVLTALHGNRSACETLLFGLFVYDAVLILPLLHGVVVASPEARTGLVETIFGVVATATFAGVFLSRGYRRTWQWSNAMAV